MPIYSYLCATCGLFELHNNIRTVKEFEKCPRCKKKSKRDLIGDAKTVFGTISTPKTLGALADKQADKLSQDEKDMLYYKHNAYKYEESNKKLPSNMKRIKKPKKRPIWN